MKKHDDTGYILSLVFSLGFTLLLFIYIVCGFYELFTIGVITALSFLKIVFAALGRFLFIMWHEAEKRNEELINKE